MDITSGSLREKYSRPMHCNVLALPSASRMTPTQRRKRTRPMKTTIRRRGRRPSKHPSHLLIWRIVQRVCPFFVNSVYVSKMVSIQTNKNKNQTPLLTTNFLCLKTLSLGPKRFLHSKGPKNVICLWRRLGKLKRSKHCRFDFVW